MKNNKAKLKIIYLAIFLSAFFLLPKISLAATYYVATNGNNSNPGTESQPWGTIQKAADTMAAGDTVYVRAGTYNARVVFTRSGSSGAYITFQPYTGETVIVSGAGLGNGSMMRGTDISYFKLIGFKIRNHTGEGIGFNGGGSHLEIRNNEISNNTYVSALGHSIIVVATKWPGPTFHTYTDVIIDGNYIHDTVSGNIYENETLTVAFNVRRFQITNNVLENVRNIGIDVIGKIRWIEPPYDIINAWPENGIISGNTVKSYGYASFDSGIYIDGGKYITIENNKVSNGTGPGIVVSTEEAAFTSENIIVRKNQVWNTMRNLWVGAYYGIASNNRYVHNTLLLTSATKWSNFWLGRGSGNIVKNNISYFTAGWGHMSHGVSKTSTHIFNYNNYYIPNAYFDYKENLYTNFTNYKTATGQDTHSIPLDPKFTNISGNDFTLLSDSPCINAGDFLTRTTNSGSGTTLVVEDARYFTDGYGVTEGDLIQVGSNSSVRVTNVNYDTNTITVNTSISWNNNDGVSYPYSGSKPDIGAYEYVGAQVADTTPPASPTGLTVL